MAARQPVGLSAFVLGEGEGIKSIRLAVFLAVASVASAQPLNLSGGLIDRETVTLSNSAQYTNTAFTFPAGAIILPRRDVMPPQSSLPTARSRATASPGASFRAGVR